MAKYDALRDRLSRRSSSPWTVSFDEVAAIVPGGLPPSAYRHEAWWANTESHVQALAWIRAGWHTEGLDLVRRRVTFVRTGG